MIRHCIFLVVPASVKISDLIGDTYQAQIEATIEDARSTQSILENSAQGMKLMRRKQPDTAQQKQLQERTGNVQEKTNSESGSVSNIFRLGQRCLFPALKDSVANVVENVTVSTEELVQKVDYVITGVVVFIGMKAVGIAQKYAVIVLMGIVAVMTVGTFLHPLNTLQRAEFHWNNLLALYSMVVFATSANQAVIQVVKGLDGNAKQIRRSIFIGFGLSSVFVLIVTGTVLLGTKGALEKELAYMQLGESIGTWAMILAGVFSLFALLTTFWSNTLALRDVVHEQIGSGNRISWLIATVPCILFAVFGVNSFIVLTRIMSGVVVLVSIMLVLTYGKSRKNAGSSPICGVIGTVPFQVLMVLSTLLSAIGALIPLS